MYEASEVVATGAAHEMILGVKPVAPQIIDSDLAFGFDEPQNDIDETE